MPGKMAAFVFLVLPYTALCFFRQVDLGLLTGWRGHLKIERFIANTPAPGPREAQVHKQMFAGALRGNLLHFFILSAALFLAGPFRVLGGVGQ